MQVIGILWRMGNKVVPKTLLKYVKVVWIL